MTAPVLKSEFLNHLTRPGPRLSGLSSWLLTDIWSEAAFEAAERSPQAYLLNGERWVNALETLMVAAGDRLHSELADPPSGKFEIGGFLNENRDAAVVVFDGCSLREIPRLLQLAQDSGREVRTLTCGRAALPSDTEAFVGGRLGLGLPETGPSRLTSRAELRERNIRYFYFQQSGRSPHYRCEPGFIAVVEPISRPALHRQHRGRREVVRRPVGRFGAGLATYGPGGAA